MTKGPVGGPRPLATGDVVLLATVVEKADNDILADSKTLEQYMNMSGWHVSVDFDDSVDTYAINTGLDVIEFDELEELKNTVTNNIQDLQGNKVKIEYSVGFQ